MTGAEKEELLCEMGKKSLSVRRESDLGGLPAIHAL